MADRTLTINHADGGSETYTIKRDKFAGVRELTIDSTVIEIDRSATPKNQSRETTFTGSSTFTLHRNIEPLLSKVVGNAAIAFSTRDLVSKSGDTTVVKLRRSDDTEKDFTASNLPTAIEWATAEMVSDNILSDNNAEFTGTSVDWAGVNATATLNQSSDALDVVSLAFNGRAQLVNNGLNFSTNAGNVVTVSGTISNYVPPASGNWVVRIGGVNAFNITGNGAFSFDYTIPAATSNQVQLRCLSSDATSLSLDNISFTYESANGGEAFIVTWYDQSGNNRHAHQTDPDQQPQLIANGSFIEGGLSFNGTSQGLNYTNSGVGVADLYPITSTDNASSFVVCKSNTTTGTRVAFTLADNTPTNNRWYAPINISGNTSFGYGDSSPKITGNPADLSEHLYSAIANSTQAEFFVDGVSKGTTAAVSGYSIIGNNNIGGANGGLRWSGTINEIIVFNSAQNSNAAAIEANINNHYSIYGQPEEINLWLTAGQSNSVGIQSNTNLVTNDAYDAVNKINIVAGAFPATSSWDYATQGMPTLDYTPQGSWITYNDTNNSASDRAFARELANDFSNVHIAKFAANGRYLDYHFKKDAPILPLFDAMTDHFNDAIAALEATGAKVNLRGFLWVQGYSDSLNENTANAYGTNLTQFISDVRSELSHSQASSMPVLVVRNATFWETDFKDAVETGREYARDNDSIGKTDLVDTTDLETRDANIHYTAEAYEEMGKRAAFVFKDKYKYNLS